MPGALQRWTVDDSMSSPFGLNPIVARNHLQVLYYDEATLESIAQGGQQNL